MNELTKFNIAHEIRTRIVNYSAVVCKILDQKHDPEVFVRLKEIRARDVFPFKEMPKDVSACIIDLEGNIFLMGVYLGNSIITIYVEDLDKKRAELYFAIFKTLKILRDEQIQCFAFSNYEDSQLARTYEYLMANNTEKSVLKNYKFIQSHFIVNLQEYDMETMAEAIFKLGYASTHDPLFRHNKIVERLYENGEFDSIIKHNENCLLNEALIFRDRWLKQYSLNL